MKEIQEAATSGFKDGLDKDKRASLHIKSQAIQFLFEVFLKIAYALAIIGIVISLAADSETRDSFISYVERSQNIAFIIVILILGVISYTLGKVVNANEGKKFDASTKKLANFLQDILRGIICVLIIISSTGFVQDNKNQLTILVAYYLYIASIAMFTILHLIKWKVFCCGSGKDDLGTWENSKEKVDDIFTKEELDKLKELAKDSITKLQEDNPLEERLVNNNSVKGS